MPLGAAAVSVIWGIIVMIRLILVRLAAAAAALDGIYDDSTCCRGSQR